MFQQKKERETGLAVSPPSLLTFHYLNILCLLVRSATRFFAELMVYCSVTQPTIFYRLCIITIFFRRFRLRALDELSQIFLLRL